MKRFPTLYKRSSTGAIQIWSITADGAGYFTQEGIDGGKITESKPHTCEAKNSGKKNATTAEQQAVKEAEAEWTKKCKRGYTKHKCDIDRVGFLKPMKGDKWVDRADEAVFPVTVQNKLNGIRCQNNSERAYSTGGETFYTIPHIRAALDPIFEDYPEAFIDGEAFNYDLRSRLNQLIKLLSVVIKEKDLTPELLKRSEEIVRLHVFDGYGFDNITPETPYLERHAAVVKLLSNRRYKSKYLVPEPIVKCNDAEELMRMLQKNRTTGGEGLMVRWGDCPFKHGRSKYMLKLKHFEDAEFDIVEVQEGNTDWVGCAKRIVLALPTPATNATRDTTFAANVEGDREWLRELYERRAEVIGSPATVEFQQYSEYGIPQIPWVRAIRNYENS